MFDSGIYYNHLPFVNSGSGDSLPGRLGGVQYVHLYRDAAKADIMQLIMYLLGFFNEFRRPDRDSQVVVHYENIAPGNDWVLINIIQLIVLNQRESFFSRYFVSRWCFFLTNECI